MKTEHWTDRLSEHIDGELSAAERAACEAHLERCPECAGTLEELRAVVAQASLMPDVAPERDLWPAIQRRLAPRRTAATPDVVPLVARRRVSMTVPQLAAAAIVLVVFSVGFAWVAVSGGSPAPGASASAAPAAPQEPTGASAAAPVVFAGAYNEAILELELEFDRQRRDLDPETIRVVEQNLAIIDGAIADAGKALEADPASTFLNTHLANAMRQKVDLLRHVAAIERTES